MFVLHKLDIIIRLRWKQYGNIVTVKLYKLFTCASMTVFYNLPHKLRANWQLKFTESIFKSHLFSTVLRNEYISTAYLYSQLIQWRTDQGSCFLAHNRKFFTTIFCLIFIFNLGKYHIERLLQIRYSWIFRYCLNNCVKLRWSHQKLSQCTADNNKSSPPSDHTNNETLYNSVLTLYYYKLHYYTVIYCLSVIESRFWKVLNFDN